MNKKKRFPKPPDFVPEPTFPAGHLWHGQARCQAWNPNRGRQCMRRPVKGKRVCRKDGGATPSGKDSPHYKHGRWSKSLAGTSTLGELFELSLDDLADRKKYLALIEGRILELLSKRDDVATDAAWTQLGDAINAQRSAIDDYKVAVMSENWDKVMLAARKIESTNDEMSQLISFGLGQSAIHDEIYKLVDQQRRQLDSQSRDDERAQKTMSPVRVQMIIEAAAEELRIAVAKHVNEKTGRAIMGDARDGIRRLIMRGGTSALVIDNEREDQHDNY